MRVCQGPSFLKHKLMQLAAKFHPIFGPILMVTYACLSNTLLLTGIFYPSNKSEGFDLSLSSGLRTIVSVTAYLLFGT